MENKPGKKPTDNKGSSPLPEEAFNRGDGSYNSEKASNKDFLLNKMDGNMAANNKDASDSAERQDILQKQADKERRTKKPGSNSNSSSHHRNPGRDGGK